MYLWLHLFIYLYTYSLKYLYLYICIYYLFVDSFVRGLFNDGFRSSDSWWIILRPSQCLGMTMLSGQWTGKRMFPDLVHYAGTCLEKERELIRNLSQERRSRGREFCRNLPNPGEKSWPRGPADGSAGSASTSRQNPHLARCPGLDTCQQQNGPL